MWVGSPTEVPPEFLSLPTTQQRARGTHWKVLLFPQGLSPELFELSHQLGGPHSQRHRENWLLVAPRLPTPRSIQHHQKPHTCTWVHPSASLSLCKQPPLGTPQAWGAHPTPQSTLKRTDPWKRLTWLRKWDLGHLGRDFWGPRYKLRAKMGEGPRFQIAMQIPRSMGRGTAGVGQNGVI